MIAARLACHLQVSILLLARELCPLLWVELFPLEPLVDCAFDPLVVSLVSTGWTA